MAHHVTQALSCFLFVCLIENRNGGGVVGKRKTVSPLSMELDMGLSPKTPRS